MASLVDIFETFDAAILAAVGDDVEIEGRPVRGEFSAPFIGPKIGGQRTGLSEPEFAARSVDLAVVKVGEVLTFKTEEYDIVRIEPGDGITTLVLRQK